VHHETELVEAVRAAWEASLPAIPFDLDASWSDTGLDSLKALEFVLRLEQRLRVKIGFDAMTPESTARDLLHLLEHLPRAAGPAVDARPTVFLLPGIFGDEVKLANFRRALNRDVAFQTLKLPDIETPVRVLRNIPATAAALCDTLVRSQPEGDIHLAGYSFGALAAQEMARQLEQRGRRVAFLGILDGLLKVESPRSDAEPTDTPEPLNIRAESSWRRMAERAAFSILMRLRMWEAARRVLLHSDPDHQWSWPLTRRHWLIGQARGWAVLRWRGKPVQAPTLLIASDEFATYSSEPVWRAMCPNLSLVRVASNHHGIFEPAPMAVLAPAFLTALRGAPSDRERRFG
jgi:thioesterase domain-containing protein/acyl carrier protein